jgi:hypothetical protein
MDIVAFFEYSTATYEYGAIRACPELELGFGPVEES